MKHLAMMAAGQVMAHPENSKGPHECRIAAMWDAPSPSWGLPECANGAKDGDDSNDRLCYCYQFPDSAVGQPNHNFGPGSANPPSETACWKIAVFREATGFASDNRTGAEQGRASTPALFGSHIPE